MQEFTLNHLIVGDALDKATSEVDRLSKPLKWIKPTLLNDWVNYDSVRPETAYAIDAYGIVYLRGLKKGAVVGFQHLYFR